MVIQMIFHEIYSAYFNTVTKILAEAVARPLSKKEMREIIEKNAFSESILTIEPALENGQWQLMNPDGSTHIKHAPTLPLTTLQKRWLRAISDDPKIKLFTDEILFPDEKPLFTSKDYTIFDKYSDGDPYTDENYINNFRMILDALKNKYPLKINLISPKKIEKEIIVMPEYLEYSEKDDKFRLIVSGCMYYRTVNVGTIVSLSRFTQPFLPDDSNIFEHDNERSVIFELTDDRNALDRVLLHFAHFKNQTEKIDDKHYLVTVEYLQADEIEILIRILSFGQMLKVIEPDDFVKLIKERLRKQKNCGL